MVTSQGRGQEIRQLARYQVRPEALEFIDCQRVVSNTEPRP